MLKISAIAIICLAFSLSSLTYAQETQEQAVQQQSAESSSAPRFSCDVPKSKCSEMESCEEATFYLQQCGMKKLDRNGDGVPCEKLCR